MVLLADLDCAPVAPESAPVAPGATEAPPLGPTAPPLRVPVPRHRPYLQRDALRGPRARTIPARPLNRAERHAAAHLKSPLALRPRTRADCEDGPRPCPWVSCRHHLYLDVAGNGSLKLNFPHLEPGELEESCALDVAERGGITLEEVGRLMNLTRERARQTECRAEAKLARSELRGLPGARRAQ